MLEHKTYYVYVDYTLEHESRPFYVGKGSASRVKHLHRNSKHSFVTKKFGMKRKTVFETLIEQESFDFEIKMIAEHKTFALCDDCSEIASNFTKGGEGTSGLNCRKVAQLSLDGTLIAIHDSIENAAKSVSVDVGVMGTLLRGRRKIKDVMGFFWVYVGDDQSPKKRKENRRRINTASVTETRSNGDVIEYDSVSSVSEMLKIDRIKLNKVMLYGDGMIGTSCFRYKDHALAISRSGRHMSLETKKTMSRASMGRKFTNDHREGIKIARSKPIQRLSLTGDVIAEYASVKIATAELNLAKSSILHALHTNVEYRDTFWKFINPEHNHRQGHKFSTEFGDLIRSKRLLKIDILSVDGHVLRTMSSLELANELGTSTGYIAFVTRKYGTYTMNSVTFSRTK